jgi:hypothetical protein
LEQLDKKVDNPTEHYGYDSSLEDSKYLCACILKKDMSSPSMQNLILGTHMLQKTAFLLAFWGHRNCADWGGKLDPSDKASILLDARHKDVSSTMTYLADLGTLKSLLNQVDPHSVHQRVGRYDPIFVKTLNNFAALNQVEGNPSHRLNNKSLSELADWYVQVVLHIDKANFCPFSISQTFNIVCAYKPDLTIQQEVEEGLKEKLGPEDFKWALDRMETLYTERLKAMMNHINSTTQPTAVSPPKKPSEEPTPTKNIVVLSKSFKQEVNKATSKIEKMAILVAGAKEVEQQVREGKVLVDPLQSWANRAGKVAECVSKCHGGNLGKFLDETTGFRIGKWACCHGIKHKACFDRSKL